MQIRRHLALHEDIDLNDLILISICHDNKPSSHSVLPTEHRASWSDSHFGDVSADQPDPIHAASTKPHHMSHDRPRPLGRQLARCTRRSKGQHYPAEMMICLAAENNYPASEVIGAQGPALRIEPIAL
jgi:hypothetical protein